MGTEIPLDKDPNGVIIREMNITNDKTYNSSIVSGSLLMEESRKIADLLLNIDRDYINFIFCKTMKDMKSMKARLLHALHVLHGKIV